MKEEALKLADEINDFYKHLNQPYFLTQLQDMIRRLVAELDKRTPIQGLSDGKVRELADKHLSYIAYDEGDGYGDVEITGELAFYDAIIEEINNG